MGRPTSLCLSGRNLAYPSEEQLRVYLLDSVACFAALTGMKHSAIGHCAVNDPAFVGEIMQGRNFKVRTFENFMTWLDRHWPECHPTPETMETSDGPTDARYE